MTDKRNHVDYHWYLVRTQPGHERELGCLIDREKENTHNILEAYCPTHTTVNVRHGDQERKLPLFDGYVFVLATESALREFLHDRYPNAFLRYKRKRQENEKAEPFTIPEEQMRAFMDFNDNYADKVVVLERPYTDYAFNEKAGEPNEIVRVIDGPLAGCEGYICRFRRERRLVFQVRGYEPGSWLTVSYPNVWDLHVVRLHNTENDRLSVGTEKGRAADVLIGILQACGYGDRALPLFHAIMQRLVAKPSLVALCKELYAEGEVALSMRLAQMGGEEAELVINLVRYEREHPGYLKTQWSKLTLRPFLTPTPGVEMAEGHDEVELRHTHFTETIRRVAITEQVYNPSKETGGTVTTTYYAHIGILPDKTAATFTLFANWDDFLAEYFLTDGKAKEKLLEGQLQYEKLVDSFRNYAPILYKVLTDPHSAVKPIQGLRVGEYRLNVLAITATADTLQNAKDELINTCVNLCRELNATTPLAVWRRYLRTVWLHQ